MLYRTTTRSTSILWVTTLLVAVGLLAPLRAETAREILDKVKALDDTTRKWTDRTQTMALAIHGKGGGERNRTLKVYDKRFGGGDDKTISFFLAPAEVKGTAFLQWSNKSGDDDQWLFLPEIKRTRRITSKLRDQSFMGTDFSYRDLEILGEIREWTEEDAASTLTGSENLDGRPCHVIELALKQEGMSYSKIVIWLDQEQMVSRKMTFYDADGVHAKTLTQSDVRNIGAIPTAHAMRMQNEKKGSYTDAALTDVAYDAGLDDGLFTQRQLKRGAP